MPRSRQVQFLPPVTRGINKKVKIATPFLRRFYNLAIKNHMVIIFISSSPALRLYSKKPENDFYRLVGIRFPAGLMIDLVKLWDLFQWTLDEIDEFSWYAEDHIMSKKKFILFWAKICIVQKRDIIWLTIYLSLVPVVGIINLFRYTFLNTFFQRSVLYTATLWFAFCGSKFPAYGYPDKIISIYWYNVFMCFSDLWFAIILGLCALEWVGGFHGHGFGWTKSHFKFGPTDPCVDMSVEELYSRGGVLIDPIDYASYNRGLDSFLKVVLQKDELPEGWDLRGLSDHDFSYLTLKYVSMYELYGCDPLAEKNPPTKWLFDSFLNDHALLTEHWRTEDSPGWEYARKNIERLPQGTEEEYNLKQNLKKRLGDIHKVMIEDPYVDLHEFFYLMDLFHEEITYARRPRNFLGIFFPYTPPSSTTPSNLDPLLNPPAQWWGMQEAEDPTDFDPLLNLPDPLESENFFHGLKTILEQPYHFATLPIFFFLLASTIFLIFYCCLAVYACTKKKILPACRCILKSSGKLKKKFEVKLFFCSVTFNARTAVTALQFRKNLFSAIVLDGYLKAGLLLEICLSLSLCVSGLIIG